MKLKDARSYKRIAGYFRSLIFELVGEEIDAIPEVKILCNSELDPADVVVSKHALETVLKERWNEAAPEVKALLHRDRCRQMRSLLTSRRSHLGRHHADGVTDNRGGNDLERLAVAARGYSARACQGRQPAS
jgi:hypothetical protein